MNKLTINDFGLIIGQEVQVPIRGETGTLVSIAKDTIEPLEIDFGGSFDWFEIDEVKPILRPLSAMSKDQKKYIDENFMVFLNKKGHWCIGGIETKSPESYFKLIPYLLHNGFDALGWLTTLGEDGEPLAIEKK